MENTNELDNVKPEKVFIKIHGENREIKFGFSAWGKLEKEFGGLQNLDKLQEKIEKEPFNTIPHLIFIGLINKEDVSEETVLDDYGLADIQIVTEKLQQALYGSMPNKESKKEVEAVTEQ